MLKSISTVELQDKLILVLNSPSIPLGRQYRQRDSAQLFDCDIRLLITLAVALA